jgi:hypothetical protein
MKWFLPFLLLWCSAAQAAGDIVNPSANSIGVGIYNPTSSGPAISMNFATATYSGCTPASCLAITRASPKTDLLPSSASGLQFNTFTSNVLAITPTLGLLIENARTNQLLNSCNATTYPTQCAGNTGPATQTTGSLATGTYTLWVNGSGSATMSAGTGTGCGAGAATGGTPVNFTITIAGTCIVTVAGSVNFEQLELGATGTSGIITTGAAGTRASDLVTLTGAAKTTVQSSSFYAVIHITGNAGILTDTGMLETNIDDPLQIRTATTLRSVFGVTNLDATLGSGSFTTALVKSAIGVAVGARSLVANNGTVVTDTTNISADTSFFVGSFGNGAGFPNAYFPQLSFGAPKPSDATLRGFTQ